MTITGAKNEIEKKMRIKVAKRAAYEINSPNMYVNLGIGMPMIIAAYVDPALNTYFHGENGLIGIGDYPHPGQEDPDLINPASETVTCKVGAALVDSSSAFNCIRGNHLDLTILGAL
jgi:3-oxoacid CoA-transferase B subunit